MTLILICVETAGMRVVFTTVRILCRHFLKASLSHLYQQLYKEMLSIKSNKKDSTTDNSPDIICPVCHSNAVYKYGKNKTGKQRYICLICNKQFMPGVTKSILSNPKCPSCGKQMHVYKNESGFLRYRCSDYPHCRTFLKNDRKLHFNKTLSAIQSS